MTIRAEEKYRRKPKTKVTWNYEKEPVDRPGLKCEWSAHLVVVVGVAYLLVIDVVATSNYRDERATSICYRVCPTPHCARMPPTNACGNSWWCNFTNVDESLTVNDLLTRRRTTASAQPCFYNSARPLQLLSGVIATLATRLSLATVYLFTDG